MKSLHILSSFSCLSTVTFLTVAAFILTDARANEWSGVPSQPAQGTPPNDASQQQPQQQQMFASPDDAVKALRSAVEANDRTALAQIFGPDFSSLLTGDQVQDAKNARHFASAMEESCQLEKQNDNQYYVDVGTNNWPMPIPITQANGQWYFDKAAGKEEVIDRHIGRDELAAIGVCRAYVGAQRQFGNMNGGVYAEKFESTPGKNDGLSWTSSANEESGPLGHLLAQAQEVGEHKGAQPFHGYYFKILTMQGSAAPGGKMNYLHDGNLSKGFALIAYPEHWNQSGVMTFIVNQDGKVYQRDFGDSTYHLTSKIKEYNPDNKWTLVTDEGIPVAER
ncbi:MAG TPA: DUF2950 domain-containing protein [Candidatus Acidoferrum sp.]|nr:DUF2950 domain-containing protein [Candidatus Acidoferrum sp.]